MKGPVTISGVKRGIGLWGKLREIYVTEEKLWRGLSRVEYNVIVTYFFIGSTDT